MCQAWFVKILATNYYYLFLLIQGLKEQPAAGISIGSTFAGDFTVKNAKIKQSRQQKMYPTKAHRIKHFLKHFEPLVGSKWRNIRGGFSNRLSWNTCLCHYIKLFAVLCHLKPINSL